MMDVAKLRKEAADAGINETGQYIVWLEGQVMDLRQQRDDLTAANGAELLD